MQIFQETPKFDFISKRLVYFAVSTVVLGASLAALLTRGLNYGIDFTGGSVVQLTYEAPLELADLRKDLGAAGFADASPQHFTGTNSFSIRIKGRADQSADTAEQFIKAMRAANQGRKFVVDQREYVGPTVGRHLYKRAMFAIVFSLLGIVIYVAFRFANPLWGLAGVAALAHDVIATLGLFSILGMEVDLVLVAAVLTIAGYSINDSIVVFDRMREKLRMLRSDSLGKIINVSINETLSRTLITSLTTFTAVIILFLIGGTVIHDFALTVTFGVLIGTYSSIAIAAPIVFQWEAGIPLPKKTEPAADPKPDRPSGHRAPKGRRERRKRRR